MQNGYLGGLKSAGNAPDLQENISINSSKPKKKKKKSIDKMQHQARTLNSFSGWNGGMESTAVVESGVLPKK